MKTKRKTIRIGAIIVALGILTVTLVHAGSRVPGTSEEKSTCNCEAKEGSPACSYNVTSVANTSCDCGSTCCKNNGTTVTGTTTPWTGGVCTGAEGGSCFGATEGTAIRNATLSVKTGDCA